MFDEEYTEAFDICINKLKDNDFANKVAYIACQKLAKMNLDQLQQSSTKNQIYTALYLCFVKAGHNTEARDLLDRN